MEKLLKKANKSNSRLQNKENSILGIKRPKFKNTAPLLNNRSLNTWSLGLKNSSSVVQKRNISSANNREVSIPMETDENRTLQSPPSRQSSSPKVVTSTTRQNGAPAKQTSRIVPSKQSSKTGLNSSRFLKPSTSYNARRPQSSSANVNRSLFQQNLSNANKNKMQREASFLRPTSASQLNASRSSFQSRASQKMPIYLNSFMPPMNAFNCASSASSVIGGIPGLNSTSSMFKFPGFGMPQVSFERSSNVQRVQELLSIRSENKLKKTLKRFITSEDIDPLHKMFFVEKLVLRIKQANGLCEAQRQFLCNEPTMNYMSQNPLVPQFPVNTHLTPEQKMEQVESWMNSNEQDIAESEVLDTESLPCLNEVLPDSAHSDPEVMESEQAEEDQVPEESIEEPSQKLCGTYALRDWTLVLGDGPTDLKLSGTVVHILMRTIVQKNHISEPITEVANNTTVKTLTCTYFLNGRIIDPENLIPETIKTSFKKIGFPKNWQEICRRWHAINAGGAPSNGQRNPHAPINNTTPIRQRGKKRLCTPKNRNITLNSTIITRSVSKKLDQKRLGALGFLRR